MANEQTPPIEQPANVEAEAGLLGALMIDNKLVDRVADRLLPEHFYEPAHGRIFSAIIKETSTGKVANPVTLRPYFSDDERMRELGGPGYLGQLTGSGAAVIGALDFADQVIELFRRRTLRERLERLVAETGDYEKSYDEMVEIAEAAINDASSQAADGVIEVSASKAVAMAIEPQSADNGVLTGIEGLDARLGPIKARQVVIVAGRPGMGKSVLATSMALGVTKARFADLEDLKPHDGQKDAVLIISMEMSAQELGERMAADLSFNGHHGINYENIEGQSLTNEQARLVARISHRIEDLPLAIVDTPSMTTARIDATVRRWKRRFAARGARLRLVIIDYLQLARADRKTENRTTEITHVSMGMKAIAKTNDVGIVALAQLSRAVEQREDKRPTMADLRESGQIEQDADGIVFLYRQEYYLRSSEPPESDDPKKADDRATWERALEACEGSIEFIVAKRRGRRPGIGHGRFHGAFQAIR